MDHVAAQLGAARLGHGPIAVIGGGWAGCAAAVSLAQRGFRVELHEAAPVLGGRARRVERNGLPLDNGQHLLLGAYEHALRLIGIVHDGEEPPLKRMPLTVAPFDAGQRDAISLTARRWRAPLGLLAGLLTAHGLSWNERIATILWFARLARRRFECPRDETVAHLMSALPPRIARTLWAPLCVAALNTPAAIASASAFAIVLHDAFAARAGASDFLLPATDLTSLFPEAAARYVVARGGSVATGSRVSVRQIGEHALTLADGEKSWQVDGAIVAVGPHQLRDAFARDVVYGCDAIAEAVAQCGRMAYEPIATVYLGYRQRFALPCAISRLDDAPGQWAFERHDVLARAPMAAGPTLGLEQLVAVVISASGPHDALDRDALVAACDAQLRRLRPALPPLAWSQAIVEKRATFACVPAHPRLRGALVAANVALAGDYVHDRYPATLEAAVATGVAAAHALAAAR